MSKLRKKYTERFTTISNTALQDKTLSFKAKGLLAYMWSLPDDWDFYETEIVNRSTDGIASVRSGLKELEDRGFLVKKRTRNARGQLVGNDWIISDEPTAPELDNKTQDKPDLDYPNLDKPNLDKPNLDNHTLLNTNTTKDLSIPSTNNTKGRSVEQPRASGNNKSKYGEFKNVLLTDDDYLKLKDKYQDLDQRINNLSLYIESKGAKYKSHYATILSWARRDQNKQGTFTNLPNEVVIEDSELPF